MDSTGPCSANAEVLQTTKKLFVSAAILPSVGGSRMTAVGKRREVAAVALRNGFAAHSGARGSRSACRARSAVQGSPQVLTTGQLHSGNRRRRCDHHLDH